jgi:hypothetical protein
MQDQNTANNSAPIVTADAIKGTKKSVQTPIVPTLLAKLAIQGCKGIHGLKSDHEVVDALLFSALGILPVKAEGESDDEAADRLATLLAQSAGMRAGVAAVEGARKLRKAAEKVEKSRLEAIAAAEEYRLAQVAAGVKTLEESAE